MSTPRTFVIMNPRAGRGRRAERIPRFRELLTRALGAFDEATTERPGHEVELADHALDSGYESIIAIGGDGTWSVVADRVVRHERDDVTLGLLPSGTGNDFGKTIGVTWESIESVVKSISEGMRRTIDVGRVDDRHFLNVLGIGFDIAVIEDAERIPFLRGDALYRFSALRQLFGFPGVPIEIAGITGGPKAHLMLIVANGCYFGGSFHIAPGAQLNDGALDLVSIGDAGPWRRARLFGLVSRGEHATAPEVSLQTAPSFSLRLPGAIRYELDGEVHESATGRIEVGIVREALQIFAPPG